MTGSGHLFDGKRTVKQTPPPTLVKNWATATTTTSKNNKNNNKWNNNKSNTCKISRCAWGLGTELMWPR